VPARAVCRRADYPPAVSAADQLAGSRHDTILPLQNTGAALPVCAGIEGMTSRYVPYASRPGRLMLQLLSDIVVALWITLWVLVGLAVHSAISEIADFGQHVERGANGVAHNMDSAGERADKIPLLGRRPEQAVHRCGRRGALDGRRRPQPLHHGHVAGDSAGLGSGRAADAGDRRAVA